MNVLVTVGTTPFNSLFKALDKCDFPASMKVTCQISSGDYTPIRFPSFRFSDDFLCELNKADAVISHAGAGTVFQLLELGKKSIVVANLERKDKHQLELANFVKANNYAIGITSLDGLESQIARLASFKPNQYQKRAFFRGEELERKILQKYR